LIKRVKKNRFGVILSLTKKMKNMKHHVKKNPFLTDERTINITHSINSSQPLQKSAH
jgi:hypothetical protein